jgi:hypothetical protein
MYLFLFNEALCLGCLQTFDEDAKVALFLEIEFDTDLSFLPVGA